MLTPLKKTGSGGSMEKYYFIYILTNTSKTVLYIGVTNNLIRRVEQHRLAIIPGFTKKYRLTHLVYYEQFLQIYDALRREKQLKGWRREKKNELIQSVNLHWGEYSTEPMRSFDSAPLRSGRQ